MKIYIYQRPTSSSYQKFSRSKPYITLVNEPVEEGDIGRGGGTKYREKKKKKKKKERKRKKGGKKKEWQIPKCRVENRRNTDAAFKIGHTYLKSYPSHVFVFLKYVYTEINLSNLREKTWGDIELINTTIEKPSHW